MYRPADAAWAMAIAEKTRPSAQTPRTVCRRPPREKVARAVRKSAIDPMATTAAQRVADSSIESGVHDGVVGESESSRPRPPACGERTVTRRDGRGSAWIATA